MKDVRIIRDETHPPIAADLLPTVQLFVGILCGFHPNTPLIIIRTTYSTTSIFAHYMKWKRGSKTTGFPGTSPRYPRRLRWYNSVKPSTGPRRTRVSRIQIPHRSATHSVLDAGDVV